MADRPVSPSNGMRAFPQPRLNRNLARFIDQAVTLAARNPGQARAMLYSAGIEAATIARLLSSLSRRRPVTRTTGAALTLVRNRPQ